MISILRAKQGSPAERPISRLGEIPGSGAQCTVHAGQVDHGEIQESEFV